MNIQKARRRYIPMSETMLYILLSLRQERHGYGIMQHVKDLTNGRIVLGAGTIYQSIGKLDSDGLIRAGRVEDRKKYYTITPLGMQILIEEAARIREVHGHLEVLR
jgi:DNA-binding PadR family transcriptional regulator